MIKKCFSILLVLGFIGGQSAVADGPGNFDLFVPDITDALIAEPLTEDAVTASSLAPVQGFWTDMVNSADVPQDGTDVYVAVLDTGLLEDWEFIFSEANVADEYGMGFSHDIVCIDGEAWLGPLKNDRGFITDLASGHGSHVASTVVGFNHSDVVWVEGVAPEATIIPVLVLDAWLFDCGSGLAGFSGGTDAMIAAGIMYVADLKMNDLADSSVVINMSLGGPSRSAEIEAAVDYAIDAGVIVVASAGNSGLDGMGYPGGLEQIISAGMAGWAEMFYHRWDGGIGWLADVPEKINSKDILGNNRQYYLEDGSSRPNKDLDQKHQDLDVSAPGAWVVGPYKSTWFPKDFYGYYYLIGTSMAAPHVSGMAALALQEDPTISQQEMESLMNRAAAGTPLPASDAVVADYSPGYGYFPSWNGGDYGSGFLTADQLLKKLK